MKKTIKQSLKKNLSCHSLHLMITLLLFTLPLSSFGQPLAETIKDKHQMLSIANHLVALNCQLDIPEGEEALQEVMSNIIFGENAKSLKATYTDFLDRWKVKTKVRLFELNKFIEILAKKEFEKDGRFACYHLSYKLREIDSIKDFAHAKQNQIVQYMHLAKGGDIRLIYDLQSHKVLTIDDVFVPNVGTVLSQSFGQTANLYTEDWCFVISSGDKEGRLVFNQTTEPHFTEYFKKLVEWESYMSAHTTPRFLRGEYGLDMYFRQKSTEKHTRLTEPVESNSIADTVWVTLSIKADGRASSPIIDKTTNPQIDFTDAVQTLCEEMPTWCPAYLDGEAIEKDITIPIKFVKQSVFDTGEQQRAYDVVEKMPSFPDGDYALMNYIMNNVHYPKEAEKKGIQGRVIVTFIVEEDGSIVKAKVINSINPYLDEEACRVIKSMPKWNPGMQNGKPVRVKYTVPVTFRLP